MLKMIGALAAYSPLPIEGTLAYVSAGNIWTISGDSGSRTPATVTAAIAECHREAGARYIVAAGCEVPRDTPHANVRAMVEYARSQRL